MAFGTSASTESPRRLENDLATENDSSKGAAKVGFYDSLAPAFLKTTSDIINGLPISVLRFIAKSKHSAVLDQTSTSDLTTEIQDGIDALLSASRATLYFPSGLYNADSGLQIAGATNDNFRMAGEGRFSKIRTTNAVDVLDVYGTSGNSFQNVRIENLALEANNASANGMRTRWTELMRLFGVTFVGSGKGLVMSMTAGESDVKPQILHCNFGGSITHGIQGGDTRVADAHIICPFFIDVTQVCIEFGYLDGGLIMNPEMFSNNGSANALRGINLKNPIHVDIYRGTAFELGGEAIKMTSPKHCKVDGMQIVGVGDNANQPAIDIDDYDASTSGYDNKFLNLLIRDTGGHGMDFNSANTIQDEYTIRDCRFENVGDGSLVYDAMRFRNFEAKIRDCHIDGESATRYPLYLDNSDVSVKDLTWENTVNDSVFRTNSPTIVDNGMVMNVTSSTTLREIDEGCVVEDLAGAITITLPSASAVPGKRMAIVNNDSNAQTVTVDPAGTQLIDGAVNKTTVTQYETIVAISNGTNWITE